MTHYEVLDLKTAVARGFKEAEDYVRDDYDCGLFEVDEDGTILRSVFIDGIEPEDALLCRDLDVFVSEINRLAKERNDLAKAVQNLTSNVEYWKNRLAERGGK